MRSLAVLGATGSIGRNTLKIASRFREHFAVKVLAAKSNLTLLAEQINTFNPQAAAVFDESCAARLRKLLPPRTPVKILHGPEGYCAAATWKGVDLVVGAMVGAAGLRPTLAAIEAGKDIALANKETLVMAGSIVTKAAARKQVRLMPVDSEHSAIFQCIDGRPAQEIDRLILTASGGPFRQTPADQFDRIGPEQALRHPNWQMGSKITIDSATLMNKGLEVIEAKWLFDTPPERIDVLVHPQSVVHSMVAFCDGTVMAQLGIPDMQSAIAYALSFPRRLALGQRLPDLAQLGALTFEPPDPGRFPCLKLAYDACRRGGTLPAVLNAANEVAVEAFLARRLGFPGIAGIVETVLGEHSPEADPDLAAILAADEWARRTAQERIESMHRSD